MTQPSGRDCAAAGLLTRIERVVGGDSTESLLSSVRGENTFTAGFGFPPTRVAGVDIGLLAHREGGFGDFVSLSRRSTERDLTSFIAERENKDFPVRNTTGVPRL